MAKQSTTRRLDLVSIPALSDEARDAVNAAFEAMSSWRTEAVENNEKGLEQVVEKMAIATQALGWPEQIVEATRSQMQSMTKAQIKLMDQMRDAWEEQIKSPNPSAGQVAGGPSAHPAVSFAPPPPPRLSSRQLFALLWSLPSRRRVVLSDVPAACPKEGGQQLCATPPATENADAAPNARKLGDQDRPGDMSISRFRDGSRLTNYTLVEDARQNRCSEVSHRDDRAAPKCPAFG
jgi:hypothetical protein